MSSQASCVLVIVVNAALRPSLGLFACLFACGLQWWCRVSELASIKAHRLPSRGQLALQSGVQQVPPIGGGAAAIGRQFYTQELLQ
jgi:hypothetical protein